MPTATNRYLDAVRVRLGFSSDNQLAAHWGISRQRISEYRRGATAFSDERCLDVAHLLNLPAAHVVADIHADRARRAGKSGVALVFEQIADAMKTAAAITLAALLIAPFAAPSDAAANSIRLSKYGRSIAPTYLTNNANYSRQRRRRRLILQFFRCIALAFFGHSNIMPRPIFSYSL